MTFEEFFKKKKIDLPALQKAEGGLFSEFERHFEQMGEKSFDHTKKYWFNKLRRQFPLPVEVKTEKVHIVNPLAEQTIIESLLEEGLTPKPAAPKPGFTPRFKAASTPKPEEEKTESVMSTEQPAAAATRPGFTPGFKAAAPPKLTEEKVETPDLAETPATPKPGFTPRFKASALPKKVEEQTGEKAAETNAPEKADEIQPVENQAAPSLNKPRFKPQMLPKKPGE